MPTQKKQISNGVKKGDKILLAAQDPGGFNSLVSVIKVLEKKGADIKVLLSNESCLIAKRNKINFLDCSDFSQDKLEMIFKKFNPQIVVTSTSFGLSLDKKILGLVKKGKIPTISVVDFWSNYKMRFSNPETEDFAYLPNAICVIDEYMKTGMEKEGFNKKILRVTGNPFFDGFKKTLKAKETYFLFVSQPFSELGISAFDEVRIFNDFVSSLIAIKDNAPVIISFHPREKNKKKFEKIISGASIKIKISEKSGDDLVDNAKMILGINSMALFRAALKGKKVVGYQPGIEKEKDVLMSNRLGLSEGVYDFNRLGEVVKKLLKKNGDRNKLKKIRRKYVENNSTQKVVKIIENII